MFLNLFIIGWYFGKVAGLLGMMDNEPRTDYYSSTAVVCANFNDFVDSWRIGSCSKIKQLNPNFNKLRNNSSIQEGCPNVFHAKSPFSECYSIVSTFNYFFYIRYVTGSYKI